MTVVPTQTPQERAIGCPIITRDQAERIRTKKCRNVICAIHNLEASKALVCRAEDKLKQAEGAEVLDDEAVRQAKDDVSRVHHLQRSHEICLRLAERAERGPEFDQALKDDIEKGVITRSLDQPVSCKLSLRLTQMFTQIAWPAINSTYIVWHCWSRSLWTDM